MSQFDSNFFEEAKKAQRVFHAINHAQRRKIIEHLDANGETIVNKLIEMLGVPQPVCSQQLAVLRRAGIIKYERKRREHFYTINQDNIDVVRTCLRALIGLQISEKKANPSVA